MFSDESLAYAIAAWSRFDREAPDDLVRALSGAFALVAAADGSLASTEVQGFVLVLRSRTEVLASLDFGLVEPSFRELIDAMMADPNDGRARALEWVARVKGEQEHCELVRSGATIVAAADGTVREAERVAVRDICVALGLEPA